MRNNNNGARPALRGSGVSGWIWLIPLLQLTGCGGGGGGDSNPPSAGPAPPVTPAAPVPTMTADKTAVSVSATTSDASPPSGSVVVTVANRGTDTLYIGRNHSTNAIGSTDFTPLTDAQVRVNIYFKAPSGMAPGTYSDQLLIAVCPDDRCATQISGSPKSIAVTYTVAAGTLPPPPGPQPDPTLPALSYLTRNALPHDVIDAEYSTALNAIVMVGTYPQNSIHVYDVATGTEKTQLLNKIPTSVSVSPDGLYAAVGHDALITYVRLQSVGQVGYVPTILNVSTEVFDIVLDGRGFAHAFPRVDQWVEVHTVEIATNTERLGVRATREQTRARLQPGGQFVYAANNGISPSDIEKYDVRGNVATRLYDSPYHGDYAMCGNLWLDEPGTFIYTACGNVFRTNAAQAQDMTYSGKLQLSVGSNAFMVASVSQSAEIKEVALIEYDSYNCAPYGTQSACRMRLAFYESDFLNRTGLFDIPPFAVAGTTYGQRGMFVFHTANGTGKYMISRLHGMQNHAAEYYVTQLQ